MNLRSAIALSRPLALPVLLQLLGGVGLWVILTDRQPVFTDGVLTESLMPYLAATGRGPLGVWDALTVTGYRPPLTYLPASLLYLVTGPDIAVLRVTVLAQFLIGVAVVHSLARLAAGHLAGLLAAVLAGTFPLLVGWGRAAFSDMGLAVTVVIALRLLWTVDWDRPRDGLKLGAAVGCGLLAKVAFPVWAIGPLLWTAALRLRRPRHLLTLGVAGAAALVVAGWWYLPQASVVWGNMHMSGRTTLSAAPLASAWTTVRFYLLLPDGALWLTVLALAFGAAALHLRTLDRGYVALMLVSLLVPLALLVKFALARRYGLPLYFVAAALAGPAVVSVLRRLAPAATRAAVAVLCLVLVGDFVALSFGLVRLDVESAATRGAPSRRSAGYGLLAPDRREQGQLARLLRAAARRGHRECVVVGDGVFGLELAVNRLEQVRVDPGAAVVVVPFWHVLLERHRRPTLCVVLSRSTEAGTPWEARPPDADEMAMACRQHLRFSRSAAGATLVAREGPDPIGVTYELHEVRRATLAPAPNPADPPCAWPRHPQPH